MKSLIILPLVAYVSELQTGWTFEHGFGMGVRDKIWRGYADTGRVGEYYATPCRPICRYHKKAAKTITLKVVKEFPSNSAPIATTLNCA